MTRHGNRSAVISAINELTNAGYSIQGDEPSWHDALEDFNDAQIASAVKGVKKSHNFKILFPAKIAEMAVAGGFLGAGSNEIPSKDWETWKDDLGRDYAWHPGLNRMAKPPPDYRPDHDHSKPEGRKLSKEENEARRLDLLKRMNDSMTWT